MSKIDPRTAAIHAAHKYSAAQRALREADTLKAIREARSTASLASDAFKKRLRELADDELTGWRSWAEGHPAVHEALDRFCAEIMRDRKRRRSPAFAAGVDARRRS